MKRKKLKRGIAALLSVILVAGSLAVMPDNKTVVQAAGGESTAKAIAGLGTGIIADPTVSISSSDKWKGSYVYFGNYNDTPVKYRVLDSNTTVYGGTTMLLDCDSVLWAGSDPSSAFDTDSNVWADSDIRTYLNGTFLTNNFSTAEQNAIAESTKSSADSSDGDGMSSLNYAELNNEKIFFLDAKEATNTSYGYSNTDGSATNRKKTGGNAYWWLRSANPSLSNYAGIVNSDGDFDFYNVDYIHIGVSPTLNVNLSSVLFSSVISGTAGETGAEYKLTLIDENLTIEKNGAIKREEDTVTIQCIIRGTNNSRPTQASVFLLDKEYTEGNTNDAEVLYYGALDRYGSFTLPEALSDKVCGRDYYAYIIAEDINGVAETDYASEPVKIFIPWSVKSRNLGTSGIVDPIVPASNSDAWTGSYVYFGTYDTDGDGTPEPVRYRILDSNTTVFGGKTMLLDCNSVLETRPFDDDSNVWADSDIRTYLNGTFLTGNFTTAEQNAIASSTKNAADSTDGDGWIELNFATLSGDKIFLLDAKEATNTSYGYGNTNNGSESIKKGNSAYWWLRSASSYSADYVGIGHHAGSIIDGEVNDTIVSVSPALNVDLSSVLFSSIVNGTGSYVGPEYKLTLIDENLTVAIDGTVIRSEDRITVPYIIGGTNSANATQASVLLLDKEYTEGNTNDAEVLYYGALNSNGSFTLPEALSDKVCGRDYYAYIIAEDINGVAETDYASEPVKIFIPWSVKSKNLGTSGIVDPIVPASNSDAWTGSYVYFGTYDTDGDGTPEPVRYRILDSNTTVFGGKTMLLDCNSILETRPFDDDSNVWADSDIRTYLNGTFLTSNFSTAEQSAIASSTKSAADSSDGSGWVGSLLYASLNGDKIFFLDAKEATNTSYGYSNTDLSATNRIKTGGNAAWWLRSVSTFAAIYAGIVYSDGIISSCGFFDDSVGVSPALNVNLSSVLFSSIVNGTGSSGAPEYKLTLIDENLTVAINGTVIRSEDRIMVPYTIGGTNSANATQASVFLLDKEYTEGNTNDAEVLYYGALNGNDSFTLPEALSDKVCGRDYYAYIIAEDINGVAETDYASEPVELTEIYDGIDNVAVELDAPESSEALDTEVSILTSGITGATVTWKEGETTVTGNADYSTVYTAYITVSKNENLLWTPTVTATVNGQQASVVRQDGSTVTLTYTFAVTDKERLISITNPQSITVANGTSYEEMNLPEKVYITTEGNTYTEADVEWDTANPASGSYDPDILTEQTVVLKGTVTCPEGIDSNNVSLTTTITITISADDTEPEDKEPEETEPEETEPEDKEPEETEPENKEPEETEPEDTEPEDKESEYEITDGNDSEWTADSDEGITITGSGDDEDFVGIRINGEFIDSSNYTIEENGAVTLKKEYLDTLPADTYTIDMVWNDGEASTEITIKKSSVTGSPDAGDGGNAHLWILFVIGLGLVGVVIISRRKSVID